MGDQEIQFESTMPLAKAATVLQDVVNGLRQAAITLEQGEQTISLTPGEDVTVELRTKHKDDRETLSLKLSWRRAASTTEDLDLRITPGRPAPGRIASFGE